jgi:hypothetical protein
MFVIYPALSEICCAVANRWRKIQFIIIVYALVTLSKENEKKA